MEKYDARKMVKTIKFGKGVIRTKKDVIDYIKFGYNPNRLLLDFTVTDNDALQYIFAEMSISKIRIN
jgi:hypothetical protein